MNNSAPLPHDAAMSPLPDGGWAVGRRLLSLALPTIASMISHTVMHFVDFWMVSHLGNEAQAAITPAAMLLFCATGFGMGVVSMVNPLAAQSLGRGRLRDCSAYAWQGLYFAAGIGAVMLPLWTAMPRIFAFVGHEPAVQEMEAAYARVGLLGLAPAVAAIGLANFFNGIHRPGIGLAAAVCANGLNIFGNWVLIFGNLGVPALGIEGAAWATNAAACIQMAILLAWMLRPAAHRLYQTRATWRFDLAKLRSIVWHGLPVGVQHIIDVAAFTLFTMFLVGRFGTEQLAANNIAFRLLHVSFMPAVGLGIALSAMVGKAIGEDRPALARQCTRWGLAFAMTYMGAVGLVFVLGRGLLPHGFSTDPEVLRWTADVLILCALFQVFDAMGIIHSFALRGAGDNHWPAYVMAGLAATVFLGGGYALATWQPQWGILGPWITATLYICLFGLAVTLRWRFGPWEGIRLVHPEALPPEIPSAA